jgi:hypothetical protein
MIYLELIYDCDVKTPYGFACAQYLIPRDLDVLPFLVQ